MGKAETDYQLGSDPVELERLGQQGRVPAPATPMAARQQEGGSTCQGLPTVLLAFFYSVFRLLLDVPSMGVTGGRPPPSQPDGRRIEAGRSDPPRPHRGPPRTLQCRAAQGQAVVVVVVDGGGEGSSTGAT
jgi:hypothetical protein